MFCRALVIVSLAGCARIGEEPIAKQTQTIVSLTFDDTFADQSQVGALVAARGMHATFFVNSGRVGAPGYMTQGELLALQQAGNEIGGHTVSHADLPTLELDEGRRQVCNDRVALLALGFQVASFAYPFGDSTGATEQIAAACGYNSARGVGDLVSGVGCHGCAFANPVPPTDPYDIKTNDSIKIGTTLEALETYVTQAEANGGGWVPLVMHHVCDGCDPLSVSPATLGAFLDWLAVRDGTVVETVQQVIGGAVQPGVPGPPAMPHAASGNLIANPSLEDDANHDAVPDCWQRGGTGTSTASYTLTSTAYAGNVAQRIDITSFTSGARRLVTRQDLGACAPVAYPGHAYVLSAAYATTTPARFTIYQRTAAGGWLYLTQSPAFPPTSSYAVATFAIPALPAEATALSVGLSIYDVGALAMDAFTLTDADVTPPGVALTAPADGQTVGGTVALTATATDAGGIDHVDFLVDGAIVGTARGAAFSVAWDTTTATANVVGIAARAVDLAGNATISTSRLVTIANAPGGDTTPPTVALTSPAANATVTGDVLLAADASDDTAIQHVDFFADGQLVGSAAVAPYTAHWTPSTTGTVALTARAFDTGGNATTSAAISVSASPALDLTPPTIAIACTGTPCTTAWTNQRVAITFAATPSATILYSLDGNAPTTPYAGQFLLASRATVRFVAISPANVGSDIGSQLVNVDTIAPTAAISSPAAGAHVHGLSPIVATVGDDVAVTRVRFYLDGRQLGTRVVTPFKWNWDASTATPGAHTLTVQAEDAANNTMRATLGVTVD